MSRHYTTNTNTLYLRFVEKYNENVSLINTDCDGSEDGFIEIRFSNDLLERYKSYGTEDELKAILEDVSVLLGECEWLEIGSVKAEGWYEPPHYCWSDPSCSDPGDGETTSVTADLCSADDIYDAIKETLDEAIIYAFEAENLDHEKYNKDNPQSTEYMLQKYLEGIDMADTIRASVYAKVVEQIPWLCNDIIKLDGEEI